MRKIKQKKSPLNLVLNSLKPHDSDPTLLQCTFIILDFEKSRNNVVVPKDVAMDTLAKSIINKPIRAFYNETDADFGGHEVFIKENKDGEKVVERNTVPMGTFTSEGYIQETEVDGELREVLVADAVLWHSQFVEPCNLLLQWFNSGQKINMSCEYLFSNYEVIDGVETHKSPIYLEAHCILGSSVVPAYESATVVDATQLNQFTQLVAQAINQESDKEVIILPEEIKDENLETNEEEVETEETQTQLNELSHRDIRNEIERQLDNVDGEWVWVSDVYETHAIVHIENNESYSYYKFDYSKDGENIVVDTSSKVEVKEKREWVTVTNELEEKINQLESDKEDLASKFNEATETILTLNATIEELKPFQELALNAKREEKLVELNEKFSKAFNNAGAKEKFESEDVQKLLNEAVDSSDALSQLNSMVVELVMNAQVKPSSEIAILGLNSERKNLIEVEEDEFEKRFKL